jgi:hypothetical protein
LRNCNGASKKGRPPFKNVQNVQNPYPEPTFERFERFERQASSVLASANVPSHTEKEGAGDAEHNGEGARAWAEGLAQLDSTQSPGDVPPNRWLRFIENCRAFLGSPWAERAAALGWGPLDLFGCDRERPFARINHQGLLWLLDENRIVELHRDKAKIETSTGAFQTYRRHPVDVGRVVLAWELSTPRDAGQLSLLSTSGPDSSGSQSGP